MKTQKEKTTESTEGIKVAQRDIYSSAKGGGNIFYPMYSVVKNSNEKKSSLCSQKEFPLKDITKQIISCASYEAQLLTYLRAMKKRVGFVD